MFITLEEIKRVTDEIELLKKLSHPHIISLKHSWEDKKKNSNRSNHRHSNGRNDQSVILFLRRHLKRISDLKFKVFKRWCIEILKGLEYLHSQKPDPIVHRDLKCDNIFINSHKGNIMIGDLGYASILSNHSKGSVLGTPEYMAPEVLEEHYTSLD
jgi:WNK lysine deficient protein kinase